MYTQRIIYADKRPHIILSRVYNVFIHRCRNIIKGSHQSENHRIRMILTVLLVVAYIIPSIALHRILLTPEGRRSLVISSCGIYNQHLQGSERREVSEDYVTFEVMREHEAQRTQETNSGKLSDPYEAFFVISHTRPYL